MAIPPEPYSGCDCCGQGYEIFIEERLFNWYLVRGNTNPTSGLERIGHRDGLSLGTSAFNDAQNIQVVGTLSRVDYFYAYISNSGTANPPHIKKYDINGNLSWDYTATGMLHLVPGGSANSSHRIAVDRNGYSYITGTTNALPANRKLIVQKVDSSGSQVWSTTVDNPSVGVAAGGTNVIVDRSGNVAAIGAFVVYLNSSGAEQWKDSFGNAYKVCFDKQGNVYGLRSPGGVSNQEFRSWDSSGAIRFTKLSPFIDENVTPGGISDFEIFRSRLYGSWVDTVTKEVVLIRRSDSTFSTLDWRIAIPYTETSILGGARITVDSQGNLYAIYTGFTSPNSFGYFTRRAASTGAEHYSDGRGVNLRVPLVPPGRPPSFI